MRKDIPDPEVNNVAFSVVQESNEHEDEVYNVYLLNLKDVPIRGVLVASKGYGYKDGKKVETSTLRHFFEEVKPDSYVKVETIMEEVFGLNNQYWLSFYIGRQIYDKKYIFLPETISQGNFTRVPLINKPGVLIK